MATETIERRLAAILAADIVGFTRLMRADEGGTHARLRAHRKEFIEPCVERHGGRIVKLTGDGLLVEFTSVADALNCAIDWQQGMRERNARVPEDQREVFRIGVNLGDVIHDDGDIYGDGVNVAARLEGLAEPGAICVSEAVYQSAKAIGGLAFDDLGAHTVKNIAEPVRAYGVRRVADAPRKSKRRQPWHWVAAAAVVVLIAGSGAGYWLVDNWWRFRTVEAASLERMAFPLPDKPSIAVLPFDNLSGDPEQDYFADGITENIITTLSQITTLFVISRNSTFVYKGKPVKVQQVAEELGVRFVLEGSVQRSGERVRITAQLIDALTGSHLWAERYDRQLADLFDVQDEITREIVFALQVELTEGEQLRVWRKSTRDTTAWQYLADGLQHFHRFVRVENTRARELFEKASEADPQFALAHALTAWTHWMDAQSGWSDSPTQSVQLAIENAQEAFALDPVLPDVHALLGAISMLNGDYEQAIAAGERAVALNPNHATNTAILALILNNAGRREEAIARFKSAMRLSPYYSDWFLSELAWAYEGAGQGEQAIAAFSEYIERKPEAVNVAHAHIGIALSLVSLGREDEARAEIVKALEEHPKLTASEFSRDSLTADRASLEQATATLRRLGLPE